jgi:hypothetical protein
MSYTYTNENPYCEAYRAENIAYKADFGVAEVKPVQLNPILTNTTEYLGCRNEILGFDCDIEGGKSVEVEFVAYYW